MTIDTVKTQIKETSALQVVEAAIERAKGNPNHALLQVIESRAIERAKAVDAGTVTGKLAGVPFVAKDNMLTFDGPTTAASKLLENFEAPFQSEAVERLEAEGAICIAKANLDAFAHGGSTENSAYGPTSNPHDETRVAGGSSGGSAASVALDIVPFALGTDTGGSIRQPASFNGVVGLKPSYGAVSRYGVVAMASSTDVVGPLTESIADAQLIMSIISGKDAKDATTIESPYAHTKTHGKKIGLIKEWLGEGVDDDVRDAVVSYVEKMKRAGYTVDEVSLPDLAHALAVYYIIVPAEIASNLARYDGVRYGVCPAGALSLSDVYEKTRTHGFMPENIRRIMIGNYVLSSGYYDAYFEKAARVRTKIVKAFETQFAQYDFLLGPTAPTTAFKLGQNTHDPLSMYLADQMTVSASLAGNPAVSLPLQTDGMPIGLQLVGAYGDDAALLAFASEVEAL